MLSLSSFQKDAVATGAVKPNGTPTNPPQQAAFDPIAELNNASAKIAPPAQGQAPSTPAPTTETGMDWGAHYKKLFAPTAKAAGVVGNFLTSSEQKAGNIIGDSLAGVEDQAAQNDANTSAMQAKMMHTIATHKQEGKDTSHLEWALANSQMNSKSAQQQIAEQAPGSLATNEEALGAIGEVGLDLATAGLGGGKNIVKGALPAERTATEILKESGKSALKGAATGAAYGATGAMQDNGSASDVAGSAALGGAIGFALPAAIGAGSAIKQKLRPNEAVAIRKYAEMVNNIADNRESTRKMIAKGEKFGKDPRELLAEKAKNGSYVPIGLNESGRAYDTASESIPRVWQDTNDLLDIKKAINNVNPARVSLEQAHTEVMNRIRSSSDVGDLAAAEKQVNQIFHDLASDSRLQHGALSMNEISDIVSKQWKEANSLFTKTNRPDFASSVHYQIGAALNDIIDKNSQDVRVKDLNALIGHHLETIKFLEHLNGKTVSGGRLGENFGKVLGAMAGSHAGPGGMIAGSQMGRHAAKLANEYSARDPFVGSVLENISKTNPAIVMQAQEFLAKNADKLSKDGQNLLTKLPEKSTKGVLDLSGGKQTDLSKKATRIGVTDVYQEANATEKARKNQYRNGGAVLPPVSSEPIPLAGDALPNTVAVGGQKPPKNWKEAINRSQYEENRGMKPTISFPETKNVIDAKTGDMNATDLEHITKYLSNEDKRIMREFSDAVFTDGKTPSKMQQRAAQTLADAMDLPEALGSHNTLAEKFNMILDYARKNPARNVSIKFKK